MYIKIGSPHSLNAIGSKIVCDECDKKIASFCDCTSNEFEKIKDQIDTYTGTIEHYIIRENFTATSTSVGINNCIDMTACCKECTMKLVNKLMDQNFDKIKAKGGGPLNARLIYIMYNKVHNAQIIKD